MKLELTKISILIGEFKNITEW